MCYKIIFDLTCLKMSDYFIFSPVCLSVTRGHSYKLSNNRDQWSCSPSPACRRFNYDDWRQPAPTYGQSYSRLPAQPINTARNRCGRHHAYRNCPAVNASCMNCEEWVISVSDIFVCYWLCILHPCLCWIFIAVSVILTVHRLVVE